MQKTAELLLRYDSDTKFIGKNKTGADQADRTAKHFGNQRSIKIAALLIANSHHRYVGVKGICLLIAIINTTNERHERKQFGLSRMPSTT